MRVPQRVARITGLLYLGVGLFGAVAQSIRATVYVPGDAAATAQQVADEAGLLRFGIAVNALATVCWLFTAIALYLLFKPVHANWARAIVVFVTAGAAMDFLNLAHEFAAITVAVDGVDDSLVLLMFDLHHYGALFAQVFFGLWLLPMGYLAYVSGMIPRVLGVFLMIGCFGWITDMFVRVLAPGAGETLSPFLTTPSGLAELAMILWLVVRGVKSPQREGQPLVAV